MHIMVVEHDKDVVDLFFKAIQFMGHTPISCVTLDDAAKYLENPANAVDIMYLDNHFPSISGGGFGVNRIDEYLRLRPALELVITTNQQLSPDLVDIIKNSKVGFFVKATAGSRRLEADIAQRVARIQKENERTNTLIQNIRKASDSGTEGFWRLLHCFRDSRNTLDVKLLALDPLKEKVIMPRFERYCTVHVGQKIDIERTTAIEFQIEESLKASSEFGLGLGLDESSAFFTSPIGLHIKSKLTSIGAVKQAGTIRKTLTEKHEYALTETDSSRGIIKREFFWGYEFSVWSARIAMHCLACDNQQNTTLKIFVPSGIAEASVAYDKAGRILNDGRHFHHVISD